MPKPDDGTYDEVEQPALTRAEKIGAVVEAANEWLVDREPKDPGELRLALALCEAYPERMYTKEQCTGCSPEQKAECDECCPTVKSVIAGLRARLEQSERPEHTATGQVEDAT